MPWFSFFNRLTFICNLCFLAAVILRYYDVTGLPQWIVGTLLALGLLLSVLLNIVFIAVAIYLLIGGKRSALSPVLTLLNFCIAIFQFTYFLLT